MSPINIAFWLRFFFTPKLESKHIKKKEREREKNLMEMFRKLKEVFGENLEEEGGYQRRN